jgi:hypothetical protein
MFIGLWGFEHCRTSSYESQIGDLTIELSNNFITNFMQGKIYKWNKRLGINSRTLEIVPFHFLPFVK